MSFNFVLGIIPDSIIAEVVPPGSSIGGSMLIDSVGAKPGQLGFAQAGAHVVVIGSEIDQLNDTLRQWSDSNSRPSHELIFAGVADMYSLRTFGPSPRSSVREYGVQTVGEGEPSPAEREVAAADPPFEEDRHTMLAEKLLGRPWPEIVDARYLAFTPSTEASAAPRRAPGDAGDTADVEDSTQSELSEVQRRLDSLEFATAFAVGRVSIAPGGHHDGIVIASVGKRIGAAAIDWATTWALLFMLVNGFYLVLSLVTGSAEGVAELPGAVVGGAMAIVITSFFASLVVGVALTGRSIGKLAVGLRVVTSDTYRPPGWKAVVRSTFLFPAFVLWPYTILLILSVTVFDKTGRLRGWHDTLAGTIELDTRAGVDPSWDDGPFEPPVRLS